MAVGGVVAATGCNTDSDDGLTISAVRGGESDLYANYTIVAGNTEAMVIDMPFTRSGAQRLTEEIRTTGKDLR